MVDTETCHVYAAWKFESIVYLVTLQSLNIEVEPFEVEDKIVWNVFEARPDTTLINETNFACFANLTFSPHRQTDRRTIHICTCCLRV